MFSCYNRILLVVSVINMEDRTALRLMIKPFMNRWNCIGVSPRSRTNSEKLIFLVTLFFCLLFSISAVLNIVFTKDIAMPLVIDNVIVLISFIQVTAKLIVCYLKPDILDDMINTILHDFWTTESVDPDVARTVKKMYSATSLAAIVYRYAIVSCVIYIIVSIIDGNFAWDIWVPFDKEYMRVFPYYEIVVSVQIVGESFAAYFAMAPFDMFFMINMGLVCGQLHLLKAELNTIGRAKHYNVIIKCVKQHNLILLFLEKLKAIYTLPILIIFSTQFTILTLALYVNVTNNMGSDSYRFFFIEAAAALQLLFYSFCGQILKDESFSVSIAAYNADWQYCDRDGINSILNIMCRAQREVSITMGGFQILSLEGFVNIGRTIFSFVTVMRKTIK